MEAIQKKDETKTRLIVIGLCCLWLSLTETGYGQVSLPRVFSDNMVLQQKSDVPIWGKDRPGTKVNITCSWGAKAIAKADNSGRWKVEIRTPAAGGPFLIYVKGSSRIVLKNIMAGEVWLCAGQSNMAMKLQGNINEPVENSNRTILESANPSLRVFTVEPQASLSPKEDVAGAWSEASPTTSSSYSATAYYFGVMLQKTLKVPIGLIVSAYNGTSIVAWSDKKALAPFPEIEVPVSIPEYGEGKKYSNPQNTPTFLYNAMIHPLVPYTIKGAIWYQGESDRGRSNIYDKLFANMIEDWRQERGQPNLPFYFVQIAPFYYWNAGNAAFLREAQLHVMQKITSTGMVVTQDVGDEFVVHASKKKQVGDRLAYWALSQTYGIRNISYSGPIYKSFEIDSNRVNVFFDYAQLGFSSFGKKLTGFQVAGADKKFHDATAVIRSVVRSGKTIPIVSLYSVDVPKPIAARYAFENYVEGSLYNTAGLPASSFRTDTW